MAESLRWGAVTRALLAISRTVEGARALAEQICQAYVLDLHIDGAAISLLTASGANKTLCATDATAEWLDDQRRGHRHTDVPGGAHRSR